MNKNQKIAIAALLVFSVLGAGFVSAFAGGFGGFKKELTAEELEAFAEERQQMTEAIESGDYETWKALMEEKLEKMKAELTEENFNLIVEKHGQMKEGMEIRQQIKEAWENEDYETVEQLKSQMGSLGGSGCPKGKFGGHRMSW